MIILLLYKYSVFSVENPKTVSDRAPKQWDLAPGLVTYRTYTHAGAYTIIVIIIIQVRYEYYNNTMRVTLFYIHHVHTHTHCLWIRLYNIVLYYERPCWARTLFDDVINRALNDEDVRAREKRYNGTRPTRRDASFWAKKEKRSRTTTTAVYSAVLTPRHALYQTTSVFCGVFRSDCTGHGL